MKKIKNLANMNYLWLLLGSYFIVVLFNLLRFSTEALFLKLGEVGIVGTIIGVVIIYPFLWFIGEYKKLIDIGVLNTFFLSRQYKVCNCLSSISGAIFSQASPSSKWEISR